MTRPLVLFTDETDLDPRPGRALLEAAGCDTMLADLPTREGIPQTLPAGADRASALVVGYARIDETLLRKLPSVGCIATMSAGTDMVDLEACKRRGIWLVNLVDAATEEVAAHALMFMLALERHLAEGTKVTAQGGWTEDATFVPRALSSLTLGLWGYGRIARRLAAMAAPIVGRIIAHDPYATADGGVELVGRERLLAESDILSLHTPLAPETTGILDGEGFDAMKDGATLVNVARGELVNSAALHVALESGRLRGAGLDVLAGEPPATNDPLRTHSRVLVTPHIAYRSAGSLERYTLDPARNVLEWMHLGKSTRALIDGNTTTPLLGEMTR